MADWMDLISQNNAASSPQTQATVDLLKQQAIGADLTNQGNALSLQFRKNLAGAMTGAPGGPNPAGGAPDEQSGDGAMALNDQAARQHLFQRYSPVPDVWGPDEINMRTQAALSGVPGAVDAVKAQHDARITSVNNARAKGATQEYNSLYGVVTAPDGHALDALSLVDPQEAARLKAAGVGDDEVRQHAESLAGLTHSVAQLPVEYKDDGVARDKATGQVIPGYDNAVGLSAKDRSELVKTGSAMTTIKNSDGSESNVPQWKADGYSSLEGWVSHSGALVAAHGVSPSQASTVVSAAAAKANAPKPPAAAVQPPAPAKPSQVTADPTLKAALADSDYKVPQTTVKAGTSATPAVLDQQKATVVARTDLLKDGQEGTANAAQSLAYAKAAQQILQSKGAPLTGLPGHIQNLLSQWSGGAIDASNYQEAAKYLGNLALQGARSNYGTKMTSSEVMMQKDQLSASVHMSPEAINNILSRNIRDAQYVINSASRMKPYLATGGDPQKYADWNEHYYSRAKIVNGEDAAAKPGANTLPPTALSQLAEGKHVTFGNGQTWTLQGGHPVRVK